MLAGELFILAFCKDNMYSGSIEDKKEAERVGKAGYLQGSNCSNVVRGIDR